MNHEQYIELETAKLTKQAGFDWECEYRYIAEPDYKEPSFVPKPLGNGSSYIYPAPPQSVLQRWLREVKNVVLLVDFNNDEDCEENERYGVTIYIGNEHIVELATYPTYEATLEAGLQKCLTLIIDEQ